MWGAASYLQIMASELSDKLLAEILELDAELTVTMHIQTVDQLKAIKLYEVEHENVGTEGAHRSELAAESVYRFGRRKLRKAIREHPAKAVERAESKHIKSSGGTLLLVLAVAVIGGGAGWYFKIYRPKKQQAADAAEDYGDDYDDTPPWEDEEETESEGEE